MKRKSSFREVFSILQNVERYFEDRDTVQSNRLLFYQFLVICLFSMLYGMVMGSYYSFLQSLASGVKLMFLFLSSILICFPSFFVIQQVLGSKMSLRQMLFVVMSGLVLSSTIALSFSPIVILFQVTGGNYHFLQLLHVGIFIFSGIFGMRVMVEALKFACENKGIYPRIGVAIFRVWIIILAFVGIQIAWNLRPFLCNKDEEFKLFRQYEGNFYTAIVYSIQQLSSGSDDVQPQGRKEKFPPKQEVEQADQDSTVVNFFN